MSTDGRPAYLVQGKLFCCHRSRRRDAVDPDTGKRLDDVLMSRGVAGSTSRAGLPFALASRLAEQRDFDLHALIELVERGCLPPLAGRILAPLDDEGGSA